MILYKIHITELVHIFSIEGLHLHHTAFSRGYVRKDFKIVTPYEGKYGRGYIVEQRCPFSTRYHYKTYFVGGVTDGD